MFSLQIVSQQCWGVPPTHPCVIISLFFDAFAVVGASWCSRLIWIGIVSEGPLHIAARFWGESAFDYGTLRNYSFLMSLPSFLALPLPKFLTPIPLAFDHFLVSSCQSRLCSGTGKLRILTYLTLFVTQFSNSTSFWPFLAGFSVFYYYYCYSRPVSGFWVALWMVPWHKCNSSVSRRGLLALLSIAETRFGEKTLFSPRLSIPLFPLF